MEFKPMLREEDATVPAAVLVAGVGDSVCTLCRVLCPAQRVLSWQRMTSCWDSFPGTLC